jgi:alpha-beta hydrolase superfamily lysophospholipase
MKKWLKRIGIVLLILFIFLNTIAAFHAYKFTHFYNQAKVEFKRPEQMSGWEKTKAVLFGVDYHKRPLTASPSLPYQTFQVESTDGISLEGWYVQKAESKGTVILFHGHGGTRSGTVTEAEAFYNFGYNVCMVDFRAHGNSEGNICTIGYNESADVKAVYDFIAKKGEKNIILWGISLGAATITKALTDYKEIKPSKVILEMPFGSLDEAVKGRLRLMHLPEQPFATLLTFWGGTEQGFWGFDHNPSEYAKNIRVPVLLQWGRNDARVTEAETASIFSNLATNQKQMVVYNESGHESLLKSEREKWLRSVKSFLEVK